MLPDLEIAVPDGSDGEDGPGVHEWGYIGRKFFAEKMWVPTAAKQFLAAQVKSLQDYPPRQGADTLSLKKAIDQAMEKLNAPNASSN